MVRIVKKHQLRKNEILDTAQNLFYSRGYDNTSVADVINTIGIAKGTFYHYFKSKTDLLDQIIHRQAQKIDQVIDRILQEPEKNALVELNNIFAAIGEYKAENKEVMLMMARTIYSDENIILLRKLTQMRIKTVAPKLAPVITRGVSEGLFHTEDPQHIAELILTMSLYISDEFARMALEEKLNSETKKEFLQICSTYEDAVERILGAPKGTFTFCDKNVVDTFFNK